MIATVTAGPARAINSSSRGREGMRSSLATPPIGRSVMLFVFTPKRAAMRA